ncbi:MAG TPA: GNAT family N-acetyltransferase [Ruminococcaceae bacterium]|nr:GNAT family N-acetyltransferase [Oscillospiraceae bacterium]
MNRDDESNYTVRPLTIDDIDQYNALLRYAFQVTEQELSETGWKNDEIKRSKFPVLQRADVLGCFNGNDLVSQFAVYPLEMNIYNVKYPVGFVTSVCTYPEHTGHGIMKRLMIQSLTRMRENHRPFALLYPYSIPLYRRLGWEIISNKMTYIVKDTQIPRKIQEPGYVRRVEWNDRQFMDLHTKFAQKTHGCLYRNNLAWEEYWRWDEDDTNVAVYYNVKDKPCGYMVYLIKNDIMHIKEMVYLNREAQKGLWEYIHAHDSMIDEVHGSTYFSEPIAFEIDDGDIKETIRPYAMGRIVDVASFLEDYPCDPDGGELCIDLEIEDDLLPWNDHTFRIRFADGGCTLTDAPAEYHLKMGIGTLSTLLLGYKTAERLFELERIEGREDAVERLDDVLFHKIPYISDYI